MRPSFSIPNTYTSKHILRAATWSMLPLFLQSLLGVATWQTWHSSHLVHEAIQRRESADTEEFDIASITVTTLDLASFTFFKKLVF